MFCAVHRSKPNPTVGMITQLKFSHDINDARFFVTVELGIKFNDISRSPYNH